MTRKEEIARASKDYHIKRHPNFTFGEYLAFIDGAQWADRTMIEKACEWLHTALYLDHERSIEHRYATLEDLLNDFRNAMKGGEK